MGEKEPSQKTYPPSVRKWMKDSFEEVWRKSKETPRGMVIKTTRKYVAKLFFYEGINAIIEHRKEILGIEETQAWKQFSL